MSNDSTKTPYKPDTDMPNKPLIAPGTQQPGKPLGAPSAPQPDKAPRKNDLPVDSAPAGKA